MIHMKKISAVIACYNDEQSVPHMYRRLTGTFSKIGVDYEIIFVNDGSPDNTEKVLANLVNQDGHVIAVNHSKEFQLSDGLYQRHGHRDGRRDRLA